MFTNYFGVPQSVMRLGTWARLKPSEQSLYICLLHESERYSTRRIRRSDSELVQLSGGSSRAFRNARIKLKENGLIDYERGRGNVYVYMLCDPATGRPWPGDPKAKIAYLKKSERKGATSIADNQRSTPQGVPVSF
jgi:hypothetical protein